MMAKSWSNKKKLWVLFDAFANYYLIVRVIFTKIYTKSNTNKTNTNTQCK